MPEEIKSIIAKVTYLKRDIVELPAFLNPEMIKSKIIEMANEQGLGEVIIHEINGEKYDENPKPY